jgi:glycosyltransferase involved in cell wall biosynthesis
MNILFVSGHLPSPDARQAGQKVSYHLCRFLARRHRVDLLSFATVSEYESCHPGTMEIFATREVVPITTVTRLLGLALAPDLPAAIAARSKRRFHYAISSAVRSNRNDVVLFDNMAMWQYAADVGSGVLRVGIAQDVLSQLWTRKAENGRGFGAFAACVEARRLRRWEASTLRQLDLVCALSDKDSQLLSARAEDVPQFILQPWFSQPLEVNSASSAKEDNSIVFAGAFDRHENVDAAAFAATQILPRVAAEIPQYEFHLAGAACEKLPGYISQQPRVRLAGFVPDLQAFLSRMQIALLPLRLGAGIKIKVLEAMAAGLPVVTTPVGAEGIEVQDGVHFLVGSTAEELSRHAIVLLRNPGLRVQVGERAREFIQHNYDFEKSARDFEWTLLQRLSERQFRVRRTGGLARRDAVDSCARTPGQVASH